MWTVVDRAIAESALQELDCRGFCKGNWENVDGQVCLEGALGFAIAKRAGVGLDSDYHRRGEQTQFLWGISGMRDRLEAHLGKSAWEWNDRSATDETYEEAAARVRNLLQEIANTENAKEDDYLLEVPSNES